MKIMFKSITLAILSLLMLSITNITAQEVMESDKVMSKGLHSSAAVELSDVDEREVETWWREFLRNYDVRKIKRDRKNDELFIEGATISSINGANPINLYTKIESAGKYTALTLWAEAGESYISSETNSDGFSGMQTMLEDFKFFVETEKVKEALSEEESTLKNLERDLEKLQRDNERYHKEIEKAEETIRRAEENIIKNEEEQKLAQTKIEDQMQAVEEVRVKLNDMKEDLKKNKN